MAWSVNSPESEEQVVGGCLVHPKKLHDVIGEVHPDDFSDARLRAAWQGILAADAADAPVDAVSVWQHMQATKIDGVLRHHGGVDFLTGVMARVVTVENLEYHARVVAKLAERRRCEAELREIAVRVRDPEIATEDFFGDFEARVLKLLSQRKQVAALVGSYEGMKQLIGEVERRYADRDKPTLRGVPTGFWFWDNATGGMKAGELHVLAARPRVGKSALMGNIVEHAARKLFPCLVFSLEMEVMDIYERMVSANGIPADALSSGKLTLAHLTAMHKTAGDLAQPQRIWVDGEPELTITELRSRARRWRAKHGQGALALIAVDYLQLVKSGRRGEASREQEVAEVSRGLKALAKELRCPVLALSQINREADKRQDKRPTLADLRECFAGDQEIYDAETGGWTRIDALTGGALVGSLQPATGDCVAARAKRVWATGRRAVLRLRTRTGRILRATANHPVLTFSGWRRLEQLRVGDRIACPRRVPAPRRVRNALTRDEAALAGYLISDGSYLKNRSISYTKADPALLEHVVSICRSRFGIEAKLEQRGKASDVDLTVPRCGPGGNPLIEWLKQIGIHGQRGEHKRAPDAIWACDDGTVAEFVAALWAGDGSIVPHREGGFNAKFVSTSRGLLVDLQRLLMRFGVVAVLHQPTRHQKSTMDIAELRISDAEEIIRFGAAFQLRGAKGERLRLAVEAAQGMGRNARVDRMPLAATDELGMQVRRAGLSWPRVGYKPQGKEICPRDFARIARLVGAPDLAAKALPLWDKIVELVADGEADTFDVEVSPHANLVAGGVYAHNSGQIEADADVVALLYREEVADEDCAEADKGTAEVNLAKGRKSKGGRIRLLFDGATTKFSNRRD